MRYDRETDHNHDENNQTVLHRCCQLSAVSCQLSAVSCQLISAAPKILTIFYCVTCYLHYHEYYYEQQQQQSYDGGDVEELCERLSFV